MWRRSLVRRVMILHVNDVERVEAASDSETYKQNG